MKPKITAIAALCCAAFASPSYGEVIWSEDFNAPELNNKGATFDTIDLAGVTRWSVDVSVADLSATTDWFRVENQLMEARDTDGEVVWLSEAIDISAAGDVTVSVAVSESGNMESADYFDLSYSIDGGDFVKLINFNDKGSSEHTLIGEFSSASISQLLGSGSSVVLRMAMSNNASAEYIRFDNVVVSSGSIGGSGGAGGEDDDLTGVCFNCPDLDKIADASIFNDAAYYAAAITEIDAGTSADMIKDVLSGILAANHRVLSYSQVWTALTETDEDPSNSDNVILWYSGFSLPKLSNGSGTQNTNQDNWNREHSWPNSHGFDNDSFEAYTDIHHLRPTDISINSARGNLDFDTSDAALSEAPENRVDSDSFEPRDAVKGQVARMMFYMDTRYEGVGSDVTPDLTLVSSLTATGEPRLGMLCRLVEWHVAYPVSDAERARNDAIYEYQGNRNPFIDHPEWVEVLFDTTACADGDGVGDEPGEGEGPGEGETPVTSGVVFISEYIEGGSFNKALELYNPGSSAIDLAAGKYTFLRYANGQTTANADALIGTIPANGTYVIAHPSANASILAVADQTSDNINHNGDDAYEILADGVVVDSFGQVGVDPGSAWGSGSFITADNTLIRNPDVYTGDAISDDVFDPSVEWTGHGKDNSDDLGQHTITAREIFISEYIEGSSFNKAIELYNPSGVTIDLAAGKYRLELFSNGNGGTPNAVTNLSGMLAGGDVVVIANPEADSGILDLADQLSDGINHNGDDAYVLYKDQEIIDSFGQKGTDPGAEWGTGLQSSKDNTLVRKASITQGDIIVDDAFDPSLEWDGFEKNTFDHLGNHNGSSGGDPGEGEIPVELGVCGAPATLISTIQGTGDVSLKAGEIHIVEAIVSAAFPAIDGFFVQEQDADMDANPMTSEGLFIDFNVDAAYPAVGDVVRVIGSVEESFGKTQLTVAEQVLVCGSESASAVSFSLPMQNPDAAEAFEGMLVTASSPLVVSDHYNLGRFGEVTLSSERLFIPTNLYAPLSDEAIALADKNARNRIILDDGVNGQNPEVVIYPSGNLSASNSLRLGDQVSSLTGILDYSFSNYRIIPTVAPTFVTANPREAQPALSRGNVTVASLNVLNLFNGDGAGAGFPTARGADSDVEFERQITKTVAAIAAMDADIVGLMEIENDGTGANSMIAQLTDRLNSVLGEGTYDFVNPGGPIGTDAIAVALLFKPANVSLNGDAMVNLDGIFNRPPLAQTFTAPNGGSMTVVVNHFKSKGCGSASGDNADQNDGQGCYNARRVAQSQSLSHWIASDLAGVENVLIIGDLNAYAKEDPITTLQTDGYTNLIEAFQGAAGYSYMFGGEIGYLDHALASPSLLAQTVDAIEWHINADEPRILDYNVEYKSDAQILDFYAPDAYRVSDHDPVMISFALEAALSNGDLDADGDIDNNDVLMLRRMLVQAGFDDMSYDFSQDGVLDINDVYAMREMCTRRSCATRDRRLR